MLAPATNTAAGCPTTAIAWLLQPLESVTVTKYDPAAKPVAVAVV